MSQFHVSRNYARKITTDLEHVLHLFLTYNVTSLARKSTHYFYKTPWNANFHHKARFIEDFNKTNVPTIWTESVVQTVRRFDIEMSPITHCAVSHNVRRSWRIESRMLKRISRGSRNEFHEVLVVDPAVIFFSQFDSGKFTVHECWS